MSTKWQLAKGRNASLRRLAPSRLSNYLNSLSVLFEKQARLERSLNIIPEVENKETSLRCNNLTMLFSLTSSSCTCLRIFLCFGNILFTKSVAREIMLNTNTGMFETISVGL